MNCARCGAPNLDAARYCAVCSILLSHGETSLASASAPLPAPVQTGRGSGLPAPQSGRLGGPEISAVWPRVSSGPVSPLQAGANMPLLRPAQPATDSSKSYVAMSVAERLGWSFGGLLLCAALVFAAQHGVRRLPQWPQEWTIAGLMESMEPAAEPPWDEGQVPAPAPEPAPTTSALEFSDAINAALRRMGVDTVEVRVADDGTASVTGSLASAQDRDAVLQWLESIPGVTGVVDKIALPPPVVEAPAPEPQPEAAPAATAQDITNAINAELRRVGIDTVDVRLDEEGMATVTGRLVSAEDRNLVVKWLESLPEVTSVVDEIELPPTEVDAPGPDAEEGSGR